MNKFVRMIAAAYDKLVSSMAAIAAALIVFMMLSISASVIFRRSNIDFAWALEVSEYILIISTLFGAGWLLRNEGHIRVDMMHNYLHGRSKNLYNATVYGLVGIVCILFTLIGLQTAYEAFLAGVIEEKVYLKFPKWILISLIPIGGAVLTIESFKTALKHFRRTPTRSGRSVRSDGEGSGNAPEKAGHSKRSQGLKQCVERN